MQSNWHRPTSTVGQSLENVIKDYLRPLGVDTNHGFAKTPVENSEVAKRRASLQQRLAKRVSVGARGRSAQPPGGKTA
jgi:hypothetical protein